jgi:broad specificity phosphatase PhoE
VVVLRRPTSGRWSSGLRYEGQVSLRPTRTPLEAWRSVAASGHEDSARLRERIAEQAPAPDVTLWILRHGETTSNARGLVTGMTDPPLTVRGRLQAQEAGRSIAGTTFHMGLTSHLQRSRETLELAIRAGGLKLTETAVDERLAERSLGQLERTPIRPRDPRLAVDLAIAPPGGESYLELTQRCLSFLLDLRCLSAQLARPLAVLVCTHQGPLRVLTAILDELSDPADVRDQLFENGVVVRRTLGRLAWPAFAGALPRVD